jgi:hypothetical protein
MVPPTEKVTPKGTSTIANDIASVEAFAQLSLLHALNQGSSSLPITSAPLLLEEAQHDPRHHRGTTDKYLPAPRPTTTAASNRSRRQGQGEEEYQPTFQQHSSLAPTPATATGSLDQARSGHSLQPPPAAPCAYHNGHHNRPHQCHPHRSPPKQTHTCAPAAQPPYLVVAPPDLKPNCPRHREGLSRRQAIAKVARRLYPPRTRRGQGWPCCHLHHGLHELLVAHSGGGAARGAAGEGQRRWIGARLVARVTSGPGPAAAISVV